MSQPQKSSPASTAPSQVAARKKGHSRRGGNRGRVVNRIHNVAVQRQDAWSEGDQPNVTYQLTRELEELFDERRDEQRGTLRDPFRGRTARYAD